MLLKELGESVNIPICNGCRERRAEISMHGFSTVDPIDLCGVCALLLARSLLEDLCDLPTLSGRQERVPASPWA